MTITVPTKLRALESHRAKRGDRAMTDNKTPETRVIPDVDGLRERIARALYCADKDFGPPWSDAAAVVQECYYELADAVLAEIGDVERESLFVRGDFTLHSGATSRWKIECDALTAEDWQTAALMAAEILPAFGSVFGVPSGGMRFAEALAAHATEGPLLVVDDVLTTGESMEEGHRSPDAIGVVLFARGPCPSWVTPVFSMCAGDVEREPPRTEARVEIIRENLAYHAALGELADAFQQVYESEYAPAPAGENGVYHHARALLARWDDSQSAMEATDVERELAQLREAARALLDDIEDITSDSPHGIKSGTAVSALRDVLSLSGQQEEPQR